MEINEFIKINRKFWSQFKIKNNGQKLLIEEPSFMQMLFLP